MRIVHVFRAPVGGLFRHVIDLATEQARRGHEVGVFCDATFAGDRNERMLKELSHHLSLGVERTEMHRNPHWTDVAAFMRMGDFAKRVEADVVHGHGSKGGLYARLGGVLKKAGPIRAYTPHGGSLNHRPGQFIHRAYMMVERLLERGTDAFLFESQFIADRYREYVGEPSALARIVLNGLHPEELVPVVPTEDAADFLYIGEFRFAKGIDVMMLALAEVQKRAGRLPTLVLVGQGPDEAAVREQVQALGMANLVQFRKPMAAREAFGLARTMLVPSRFESMPYVVLEAAGARMPLISTDVGGIPEIFGCEKDRLVPANDVQAFANAMIADISSSAAERKALAEQLAVHIDENFAVDKMATTVLDTYAEAWAMRGGDVPVARTAATLDRKTG